MFWKNEDGLNIHYTDDGEKDAPAIILHHGFASSGEGNWAQTGIAAKLIDAGCRVIMPDARGHGQSDKPHDPAYYGEANMAKDVMGLASALELSEYRLMGYSMGAIVSLLTAVQDRRITRLAIGGVGEGILSQGGVDRRALPNDQLAAGLLAEDTSTLSPMVAAFRVFVETSGGDRRALAAQAKVVHAEDIPLDQISAPTLVFAGTSDPLAVKPERLASAIPGANISLFDGDHLGIFGGTSLAPALVQFMTTH